MPKAQENATERDAMMKWILLGAIAIFVVRFIFVYLIPSDDKYENTAGLIQAIAMANAAYVADNGSLPKNLDNPELVKVLSGQNPYINLRPEQLDAHGNLVDDWGTPLRISKKTEKAVLIVSAGPDRIFGTQDDISN